MLCSSCRKHENAILLDHFPTLQQTTDYTCGNISALMVMRYYGIDDETEQSLALKMHTHTDSDSPTALPGSAHRLTDYGTNIVELYNYFNERSDRFSIMASSYNPTDTRPPLADTATCGIQAVGNMPPSFADYGEMAEAFKGYLQKGWPIMVCWTEWGGHWTVCIGYNDRGTPLFYDDDLLTMADPYDTTDGHRDGLTEVPIVHFFYNWLCPMTPKPYQLQPYLVVAAR